VLIGDALDLDTVGRNAGTIGYEILTGLDRWGDDGRPACSRYVPLTRRMQPARRDPPHAGTNASAVLIGDALDLDTVGRNAGTIGYEILTGLGSRYERHGCPTGGATMAARHVPDMSR
jgi:hypothetical protein